MILGTFVVTKMLNLVLLNTPKHAISRSKIFLPRPLLQHGGDIRCPHHHHPDNDDIVGNENSNESPQW